MKKLLCIAVISIALSSKHNNQDWEAQVVILYAIKEFVESMKERKQ